MTTCNFDIIPMRSTVPVGAEYQVYNKNRERTILKPGDLMPEQTKDNDRYICGDYEYVYRNSKKYPGWFIRLRVSKEKKSYGKILDNINNEPIVDVSNLFKGCIKMVEAPAIPDGVKYTSNTFKGCTSLRSVTHMPAGVLNTDYMYKDCCSLRYASRIPISVESMKGMYDGCMLTYPPDDSYKIEAFENCSFDLHEHSAYISRNHELDIESYCKGLTRRYLPNEAWRGFMLFKIEYDEDWLPF